MSKIEVNAIEPQCGTNLTVGASGDTITFPSGTTIVNNGSQTGFGRTGTVDWDTTPKTATFSAVSGNGYFCNTSGGAFTVNLPAGVAGAIVSLADYAATWQTNVLTVSANGSEKIGGNVNDVALSTEGQSITLVYVDSTQGWINTMDSTSNVRGSNFITATGGTTTTCGDYKIHVFTGPGTFAVSNAGIGTPCAPSSVEYLVVAGGGGGGAGQGGGGGAGGFRSFTALSPSTPINGPAALPVSVQGYPITVGSGGIGRLRCAGPAAVSNGSNSIFSTITSAGGGGGGTYNPTTAGRNGGPGGSGGGAGGAHLGGGTAGSGNTPPVSPSQGNPGAANPSTSGGPHMGGGGGGAVCTPGNAEGGNGTFIPAGFIGPSAQTYGTPNPTAAGRFFSGGGGGRNETGPAGAGGIGGGGDSDTPTALSGPVNGTLNTGGGGGATDAGPTVYGGSGGSGIVIIRYKFQ